MTDWKKWREKGRWGLGGEGWRISLFLCMLLGLGCLESCWPPRRFATRGGAPSHSSLCLASLPQEWQPRLWLPCAALPCPLEAMERDKPHARSALRGPPALCSLLAAQANRDEFTAAVGATYPFTSLHPPPAHRPTPTSKHLFLQFCSKLCSFYFSLIFSG